ncbi:hypothetical protein Taro_021237 [Colocasia esculenta]|uniref:Chromo domain-containing protein n=1 Tax=Colocasia esculenta TaxID=4460 RepID=A0A843V7L8_COLES|nr:hypothetical protein [Colocasia esculenta]
MHTFCLSSMKEIDANWLCPSCEEDSPCGKGLTKNRSLIPKKVQCIVGHRRIKTNANENALENHFLIKWKSLSHHHDSWVPFEWIHTVDRLRLWRYQRKFFSVDEESIIDHRKPEWFKVDRVIACRKMAYPDSCFDASTLSLIEQDRKEMEFLVKWMGLDYDDVTWESSWTEELSSAISKLVKRHQRATEKTDKNPSNTIICRFEKTPDYLSGGHLYDYQLEGLNWILRNFSLRNNIILADEMGLGKTVQVVSFIKCMKHENISPYPVLVIAPKSILFHWEKVASRMAESGRVAGSAPADPDPDPDPESGRSRAESDSGLCKPSLVGGWVFPPQVGSPGADPTQSRPALLRVGRLCHPWVA